MGVLSIAQSFFIFEDLQIDGQVPAGDGWAPSLTQESECINNPNTCDVVGAFLNDVCIGWVYADSEGGTTLPLMGYDDTNSETQINTFGYAEPGDVPELNFMILQLVLFLICQLAMICRAEFKFCSYYI